MATQELPAKPSLKSLKNQAKQLLHAHHSGKNDACERIKASHPRLSGLSPEAVKQTDFALADALLVIAREYGFESWPKMTDTLFAQEKHFANEPGWEWIVAPRLDNPLGTSGSRTGNGCKMMYNNRDEDSSLSVYFAIGVGLIDRDCRPVALDEEGKRYELQQRGHCSDNKSIALYGYELPYDEVPHNVVRYLGVEAKKVK